MNQLTKWLTASVAVVVLALPVLAGEATARGKIKSTVEGKNEFVMTGTDGKDNTYTLGDNLIVNRDGKNVKFADVKVGDDVSVGFDKGVVKWTAAFILVHNDANKNADLRRGTVKTWDADKGNLTITDLNQADVVINLPATSQVMINNEAKKMADIKVGEWVYVIWEKKDNKNIGSMVVAQRK